MHTASLHTQLHTMALSPKPNNGHRSSPSRTRPSSYATTSLGWVGSHAVGLQTDGNQHSFNTAWRSIGKRVNICRRDPLSHLMMATQSSGVGSNTRAVAKHETLCASNCKQDAGREVWVGLRVNRPQPNTLACSQPLQPPHDTRDSPAQAKGEKGIYRMCLRVTGRD